MKIRSLAVVLTVTALAGCGLGAGRGAGAVRMDVTDAFGTRMLASIRPRSVAGSETVMRLLERHARLTTRYGGGFVQSVDGLSGGRAHARPVDWFFYVNGREANQGAAAIVLHTGDRIWWDRHDWGLVMDTPAVVGEFPAPFRTPSNRGPTDIRCAAGAQPACVRVAASLRTVGVPVRTTSLSEPPARSPSLLVGTWTELRGQPAAQQLASGPSVSGVFVRLGPDASLDVLDEQGRVRSKLGSGAGLVAAMVAPSGALSWIVIGTDSAGLARAAGALNVRSLTDRLAIGVAADGTVLNLPQPAP